MPPKSIYFQCTILFSPKNKNHTFSHLVLTPHSSAQRLMVANKRKHSGNETLESEPAILHHQNNTWTEWLWANAARARTRLIFLFRNKQMQFKQFSCWFSPFLQRLITASECECFVHRTCFHRNEGDPLSDCNVELCDVNIMLNAKYRSFLCLVFAIATCSLRRCVYQKSLVVKK